MDLSGVRFPTVLKPGEVRTFEYYGKLWNTVFEHLKNAGSEFALIRCEPPFAPLIQLVRNRRSGDDELRFFAVIKRGSDSAVHGRPQAAVPENCGYLETPLGSSGRL